MCRMRELLRRNHKGSQERGRLRQRAGGELAVHDQAGACAGGREGCRPTEIGGWWTLAERRITGSFTLLKSSLGVKSFTGARHSVSDLREESPCPCSVKFWLLPRSFSLY